jgi:hypothetical protein
LSPGWALRPACRRNTSNMPHEGERCRHQHHRAPLAPEQRSQPIAGCRRRGHTPRSRSVAGLLELRHTTRSGSGGSPSFKGSFAAAGSPTRTTAQGRQRGRPRRDGCRGGDAPTIRLSSGPFWDCCQGRSSRWSELADSLQARPSSARWAALRASAFCRAGRWARRST